MNKTEPLCQLSDIPDGNSTALIGEVDGVRTALIAIRQGSSVYLYINSCPHIGAPLDFQPGRFLNLDKTFIQCAMHGALFTIETGHCIEGPCIGKDLHAVPCEVRESQVWLAV